MSPTAEDLAALCALVDRCLAEGAGLERMLRAERAALEQGDDEALGRASADKACCVERLEALERERRRRFAACGFPGDPRELEAARRHAPLADAWRRFLALIERLNRENLTNGSIINLRRQQLHAAISLVSGTPTEGYGPGGGRAPPGGSRELARA